MQDTKGFAISGKRSYDKKGVEVGLYFHRIKKLEGKKTS